MTSPYERTILTHYFVTSESIGLPRCKLLDETIDRFVQLGLLIYDSAAADGVRGNYDALKPYMDALDGVPLPTMVWAVNFGGSNVAPREN